MVTPLNVSKLLLRSVPLLSSLPEDQIEALLGVIVRKSFARGTVVIAAGDVTDSLYIIVSGRLKVIMSNAEGREFTLSILEPREYFGEMLPIDARPRSASVVALESCELLILTGDAFRQCLTRDFAMTMMVLRGLVRRLREADRKIGSLALLDVYGRVVRHLLESSELVDGYRVVRQKITKKALATMIGASREMVSRVMKDLEVRGLIEEKGREILLKDNITSGE